MHTYPYKHVVLRYFIAIYSIIQPSPICVQWYVHSFTGKLWFTSREAVADVLPTSSKFLHKLLCSTSTSRSDCMDTRTSDAAVTVPALPALKFVFKTHKLEMCYFMLLIHPLWEENMSEEAFTTTRIRFERVQWRSPLKFCQLRICPSELACEGIVTAPYASRKLALQRQSIPTRGLKVCYQLGPKLLMIFKPILKLPILLRTH